MKRSSVPIVVTLATVALIGLLVYGVIAKREDSTITDALAAGQRVTAPDRRLPMLDSARRGALADYRGKVVVLNFWASWCEPCRREVPALERTWKRIRSRGGVVLGVTFRDTRSDSRAFARELGLTYPSLRDVDGRLARDYGTVALPETFVIDRSGKIAAARRGEVDAAFLDRTLPRLLAERD